MLSKDREYAFSISYSDIQRIAERFTVPDAITRGYSMLGNHDAIRLQVTGKNRDHLRLHIEKSFPQADNITSNIVGNQRCAVDLVTVQIARLNIQKGGQSVLPAASNVPGSPRQGSSSLNVNILQKRSDSQRSFSKRDNQYDPETAKYSALDIGWRNAYER